MTVSNIERRSEEHNPRKISSIKNKDPITLLLMKLVKVNKMALLQKQIVVHGNKKKREGN